MNEVNEHRKVFCTNAWDYWIIVKPGGFEW